MVITHVATRELHRVGADLTPNQFQALQAALRAAERSSTTLAQIAAHDAALADLRVPKRCAALLDLAKRAVWARRGALRQQEQELVGGFGRLDLRARLVS